MSTSFGKTFKSFLFTVFKEWMRDKIATLCTDKSISEKVRVASLHQSPSLLPSYVNMFIQHIKANLVQTMSKEVIHWSADLRPTILVIQSIPMWLKLSFCCLIK